MKLLYIGGVGRSGSTLAERILNELPGVCGLGEVAQVWQNGVRDDRLCGCGVPFRECPVWREIGRRAFGGWHNVDVERVHALRGIVGRARDVPWLARPSLSARRRAWVTEYADFYTRIYAAAASVTGAHTIIDSSKHVALAFCLRRAAVDLDLRVLHLVRDPRGVAHSWLKRVRDPESGATLPIPRYPVVRSALAWNAHNAAFDLLARVGAGGDGEQAGPPRLCRMRYEDLLADPPGTVDTLVRFAGAARCDLDLSWLGRRHVELGPLHSVSGNRMRFATGRLTLRLDDTWRTALPSGASRLVTVMCAPLLHRYGYHREPSAAGVAVPDRGKSTKSDQSYEKL